MISLSDASGTGTMQPHLVGIALLSFVLVALPVGLLAVGLWRSVRIGHCGRARPDLLVLALGAIFCAVLLLRPHADTYTALDHSAYRLMVMAFAEGRGFHDIDTVLKSLPPDDRIGVMLFPTMNERNTRDRSFLVRSLETCETEPYFYPLLPLSALGFDLVVPGDVSDYWVPVLGFIFSLCFIWVGWAYGGWSGFALGVALLVGTPLPTWLFRGYYVESVGSVLIGLALLSWLTKPAGRPVSLAASFALGLSISFHPVLIVVALPIGAFFLLSSGAGLRHAVGGAIFFIAGVVPLLLMNAFICQPYGSFGLDSLIYHFRVSASHRIASIFAIGGVVVAGFLLATRSRWTRRGAEPGTFIRVLRWASLAALAIVPLSLSLTVWSEKPMVQRGLMEFWGGIRYAFGLILLAAAAAVIVKGSWRSRTTLALAFATLPVFAYLKGAEQMEMWSQRRLLPVLVIGIVALLPAAAQAMRSIFAERGRWRLPAVSVLCIILIVLGANNARRWRAPYRIRADKGAWGWTAAIRAEIGTRLVFFDDYPASVPMAADGRTRALSPGMEHPEQSLPGLMRWLGAQARTQEVLLIASHGNPGIEDGVELKEIDRKSAVFSRVQSDGCLPARWLKQNMNWTITRVEPLTPDRAPPALHKIMSGSPLALRAPWMYVVLDITLPDGRKIPAFWSREGSGVLGPVPAPGKSVRIRIGAISGRPEPQTLFIQPPWTTPAVPILVQPQYSESEFSIPGPVADTNLLPSCTGIYCLRAATPYNPATVGLRGYARDLGALIHVIDIAVQ